MQITTSTFLEKPVSPGSTFSAAWKPALADASINEDGHVAVSRGGSEYPGLSVSIGAGSITITNGSGVTMPAGAYVVGVSVQDSFDAASPAFAAEVVAAGLAVGRAAALIATLEKYGAAIVLDGDAVRAHVELTAANYKEAFRSISALSGPSDLVRVVLPPGNASIPGFNLTAEIYELANTVPYWDLSAAYVTLPAISGASIDLVNANNEIDLGITVASKAGASLVLNWNSAAWPAWLNNQTCAIPGLGRVSALNAGANTVTIAVSSKLPAPTASEPLLSYYERVNPVFYSVVPLIGTRLVTESGAGEVSIANSKILDLHRVIVDNLGLQQCDIGAAAGASQVPAQCYFDTLTIGCGCRVKLDASHVTNQFEVAYGSNVHMDSAYFGGAVVVNSYSVVSAWLSSFYGTTSIVVKGCATMDIQNSYVQTAATAITAQAGCNVLTFNTTFGAGTVTEFSGAGLRITESSE